MTPTNTAAVEATEVGTVTCASATAAQKSGAPATDMAIGIMIATVAATPTDMTTATATGIATATDIATGLPVVAAILSDVATETSMNIANATDMATDITIATVTATPTDMVAGITTKRTRGRADGSGSETAFLSRTMLLGMAFALTVTVVGPMLLPAKFLLPPTLSAAVVVSMNRCGYACV